MQMARLKVEATGCTRYYRILWNKIDWDRSSSSIFGFIHSVFAGNPILCQIIDLDTEIHPIQKYITEVNFIPCLNTLVDSVRYFNTACFIKLLSYTQQFFIANPYEILTQCWGLPYLNILLSNSQFQYVAELYPILSHWWCIANNITFLSYNQP